jgi:hypothetical protein
MSKLDKRSKTIFFFLLSKMNIHFQNLNERMDKQISMNDTYLKERIQNDENQAKFVNDSDNTNTESHHKSFLEKTIDGLQIQLEKDTEKIKKFKQNLNHKTEKVIYIFFTKQ